MKLVEKDNKEYQNDSFTRNALTVAAHIELKSASMVEYQFDFSSFIVPNIYCGVLVESRTNI